MKKYAVTFLEMAIPVAVVKYLRRERPQGVFMKSFCFGTACAVVLLVSACSSTTTVTTTAPFVYTNNEKAEFEILGEIMYESGNQIGYIELLKAARNMYPDCDYVIDIMIDHRVAISTKLSFFLFKFLKLGPPQVNMREIYMMRGTAIKYVR